ncbi:hypothetical protein I3843_05G209400 [Carya illinoinensis]|nr:hypothetical protein I3843_05G209400 [Carya illinoinensis]
MLSLFLMKRGMVFPAGLMMVLRITVLVLIQLLSPASSLNDTHDNYSCVPSSCGNIPNISHPFRLKGDPPNCGYKRYELSCDENNHTLLSLHDGSKYYVSQINYNNYTIRIVDASIQEDNYSFIPRHFLNRRGLTYWNSNSTYALHFRRRRAGSGRIHVYVSEVVVIVNCEKPVAPGSPFHFVSTSTNCSNINNRSGSASNSSLSQYSKRYIYLNNISRTDDWVRMMDVEESCTIEQMSLTSWPGQINEDPNISCTDLRNFFSYGFELSWLYGSTLCGSCRSYRDCYLGDDNQAHCDPYWRFTFATFLLDGLSYGLYYVASPAFYFAYWIGRFIPITGRYSTFLAEFSISERYEMYNACIIGCVSLRGSDQTVGLMHSEHSF